jgi:inner membrane protein YidH
MPLPRRLGPAYLGLGVVIVGLVAVVLVLGTPVIK